MYSKWNGGILEGFRFGWIIVVIVQGFVALQPCSVEIPNSWNFLELSNEKKECEESLICLDSLFPLSQRTERKMSPEVMSLFLYIQALEDTPRVSG